MYRSLFALLCAYGFCAGYPRDVVQVLSTTNGMPWGSWGPTQFCPVGTWASGFRLRVENPCGSFCDDTALNSVELQCQYPDSQPNYVTIHSNLGYWGDWTAWRHCINSPDNRFFLTSYRLDVEPSQGWDDDTAANKISFKCRELNIQAQYPLEQYPLEGESPAPWGSVKAWSASCPLGTAICGIQTKIEEEQGIGDDTALNDVKMFCCRRD